MIAPSGLHHPHVKKTYSAPRRFDLATLFVAIIVDSLMFGVLTALRFPTWIIVSVAGFLSSIGIAQAVFFQGKMPRLASILAAGIALPMTVQANVSGSGLDFAAIAILIFIFVPIGLATGYLSGALIGGGFQVAEYLRSGRGMNG